ncbi:MAG: hypothetical protein ACXAEX_11630 [Promethearchaeota archaeon]|jgi:hypothetical protein
MPYVFITSLFPPHKGEELAKLYIKLLKEERATLRPMGKELIPNAVKSTINGMEVIGVWDIKEGKLEEFLFKQQESLANYHEIEGYKYQMDVRFKVSEALSMIGLKMPES